MNVKNLPPPAFTEDEEALIVTDLLALKKTQIGDFLSANGLPKSGTKEELRAGSRSLWPAELYRSRPSCSTSTR